MSLEKMLYTDDDVDDVELSIIFNEKSWRIGDACKNRELKKKNNRRERRGFNRNGYSPDWTIPKRIGNKIKRESDKASCLPKFYDWDVNNCKDIKYKLKGLSYPSSCR
jgi:hypothetical protein